MNLDSLQKGSEVIIDANIFIYAMRQQSKQCKTLLLRCANNELNGFLPVHVLAEIMHKLMISEARDNDWIHGSNPARQLSERPDIAKKLFRYENLIKDLFAINLNIVSLEQEDFLTAMRIQRETGLLTNDALLIAVADRLRIQAIASADKDLVLFAGRYCMSRKM